MSKAPPKPTVTYREKWWDLIPAELRALPQWVTWKYVLRKGKWTKVPHQCKRTGFTAKSNDPSTWDKFGAAATAWLNREKTGVDGIGFMFRADDPYTGIDLDKCLGPDGEVEIWARPIVASFEASYGEVSASGRGIKFFVKARLAGRGAHCNGMGPEKTGAVEMYNFGRFFATTGDRWDDEAPDIVDRQADVDVLYAEVKKKPTKAAKPKAAKGKKSSHSTSATLGDDDILRLARLAKNGPKFAALFDRGDTGGYASASHADYALIGILKFYTQDAATLDRLFRRSALYRDKWDEPRGNTTYGRWSIGNALENITETYSPPIPGRIGGAKQADAGPGEIHEIELTTERHVVVAEALAALPGDPDLYCRGGSLVTVVEEQENAVKLTGRTSLSNVAGSPKIIQLSDALIGCALTRNAKFYQMRKDKDGVEFPIDVHPTDWCIKAVATNGHYPGVRPLLAVVECPFPRSDGSIVETPGYDPPTGTLYLPTIRFQPVPDRPSKEDAQAAWDRLMVPIRQFPFEGDDDRAVWLAGLLNVIARPAIAGPVPGIAVNGNKASRGKGLAIDSIANIAYGRNASTSTYPYDKEEAGKVKVAIALAVKPMIHFDNLEEGSTYGNSALDSALTSLTVDDRILGTSRMTGEIPLRACWFLSGNNVAPGKDAHRRWLVCNLVSDLERPEERRDIDIPDLRTHVLQHRGELVRDALTILRAHALAKHPRGDWAPLGSFEAWDKIVRGAVWYATGHDCCATRRKAADDSPARQAKIALLEGWRDLPGGTNGGLTAAKAIQYVAECPDLYETLRNGLAYFGRDDKPTTARSLGNLLRGMKGNVVEGRKFIQGEDDCRAARWMVEQVPKP